MKRAASAIVSLALAVAALAGCAATPLDGAPGANAPEEVTPAPADPAATMMDTTLGSYGRGREARLIIVLMDERVHDALLDPDPAKRVVGPAVSTAYLDYLEGLRRRHGVERVADWPLASIGVRCLVFEVSRAGLRDDVVASLRDEPGVQSAQAVQVFDVMQAGPAPRAIEHDDPLLALQHGLASVQATRSHRWASGEGVSVSVIDTGLDDTHPELAGRLIGSRNFVDDDRRQFAADVHGTAVAGVIAATADNETGMVGVAPGAGVLALKACWQREGADDGSASCNSFTLAKALNFSIAQQVDVINLSLAGPPDPLLERLVRTALAADVIVVGARGTGAMQAFPGDVDGTLSVGVSGYRAGAVVEAPGMRILSTRPERDYGFFDGSSFASAHVAGLAALARELTPGMSTAELIELLTLTADRRTGEVNACRALAYLTGSTLDFCSVESGPGSENADS